MKVTGGDGTEESVVVGEIVSAARIERRNARSTLGVDATHHRSEREHEWSSNGTNDPNGTLQQVFVPYGAATLK